MSIQYHPELEQKEKKPGPGRTLLIVGGLGVMVCGMVIAAAAVYLLVIRPGTSTAASVEISYGIPTAREAYPSAIEVARQQDTGARLVSAAGAWTPVIDRAYLSAGRTGWTFHFYLPSAGQMLSVVVDRAGSARATELLGWETPPELLDDQGWAIDSSIGITDFLGECQGVLNNQPDGWVEARLSLAGSNARLVWQFQVLDPQNTILCEVALDATTGQRR